MAKKKIQKKSKRVFYDMERDGVTQSLMSLWLECREKARLYLQGYSSKYTSQALIHGSLGHGCLELAYIDLKDGKLKSPPTKAQSKRYVKQIEKIWFNENPKPTKETLQYVETALALMEITLPLYFEFWKDDFKKMKWTGLEESFRIPFKIKQGDKDITIPLRGKRDGDFTKKRGFWLLENKFKAQVPERTIIDALSLDNQIMLYLFALQDKTQTIPKGALYNIIRRPSMKQRVAETLPKYAKRIEEDMKSRMDFYFIRYEIAITPGDMEVYENRLRKIITEMYDWWSGEILHYKNTYSCLGKYGSCPNLGVCVSDDYSGLVKRKALFSELLDY